MSSSATGSAATNLLHKALLSIHSSSPRLIHTPVVPPSLTRGPAHAPKKASVAVIVRIKPAAEANDTSSNATPTSTTSSGVGLGQHDSAPNSSPPPIERASPRPKPAESIQDRLARFFGQDWVQTGTPQIFFIKRASRASDRWSSHVAFPGGRQDEDDESSLFTALRETWEEVGVDLCEKDFLHLGQLDDREITTSLGKRLLMVLSPFVFLHTGKEPPLMELQESEVASAHWIDLVQLMPPQAAWGDIPVDLGSRLAARSGLLRAVLRLLIGHMHFRCILLPNDPAAAASPSAPGSPLASAPSASTHDQGDLKLWGLTLGMTLSLLSHLAPVGEALTPAAVPTTPVATTASSAGATPWPSRPGSAESDRTATLKMTQHHQQRVNTGSSFFSTQMPASASLRAPSMAAVFPTFTSIDVNFLLYLFGSKYRRLLRQWERGSGGRAATAAAASSGGSVDRRVNYEGLALSSFYAALRSALVVSIALRSLVAAGGLFTIVSWLIKTVKERRGRQS